MIITILNGNPEPSPLDSYLAKLKSSLEAQGHQAVQLDLRDLRLQYCIGCWGCWVKTPGQCTNQDASLEMDRAVIRANFVLWAAPLKMGFPSYLLKKALDKHLPLIHPYMEVAYGEAHHLRRYRRYPRVGLLLEKEAISNPHDMKVVTDIFSRTAINFKSRLEFSLSTVVPVEEISQRISARKPEILPLPPRLKATEGVSIAPPSRLTLFNGSPRGRTGNTPLMLDQFAKGFGGQVETHHLNRLQETGKLVQAFSEAECILFGFPLYTDAMPGMVKHFIEALEPFTNRGANPPLAFLVQSGFPEGLHSRYVERYLEQLANRLGSPYLGTIVKGGGEGTRVMPAEMTAQLFSRLESLGAGLTADGRLDPAVLKEIAYPERFSPWLSPIFKVFLRLPMAHAYFDNMLKQNGMFGQRFARPFAEKSGVDQTST